jgi:hypothetical protein
MKHAAAFVLVLFGSVSAFAAAPIYRCGPDGRVYSQTPCEGGRLIDAADPRSEAERIEARRVVARERKAAGDLERERRTREAAQQTASAIGINGRPAAVETVVPPPPRAKPKHHRATKPKSGSDDFVAVAPRSAKKRR